MVPGGEVEFAEILALGLGMAGPAAMGVALGHMPLGLMATFGGLAAIGVGILGVLGDRLIAAPVRGACWRPW